MDLLSDVNVRDMIDLAVDRVTNAAGSSNFNRMFDPTSVKLTTQAWNKDVGGSGIDKG